MEELINIIQQIVINRDLISPDRFINAAFALLLALVVGFITGPRSNSATPFLWRLIDISFGKLGDRLDNIKRKPADLLMRGFLICVFMILFMGAFGLWLDETLPGLPQSRLLEIILISLTLSIGAAIHHGMRLYQVLKGAKMSNGTYLTLARTSRTDLSSRDEFTLTRSGAEIIVRLFDKACIAPLIWYTLGGLPLLFIYTSLAALSWKIAYDGTYDNTGKMALLLEKIMGFIPTFFAASLLALTTLIVPFSKPLAGIKSMLSPKKYPYEHGGAVIGTISDNLNISLGGDVTHLNGRNMKRLWSGPKKATAKLQADHLKRILYMVFIAEIYMIGALLSASMWAVIEF